MIFPTLYRVARPIRAIDFKFCIAKLWPIKRLSSKFCLENHIITKKVVCFSKRRLDIPEVMFYVMHVMNSEQSVIIEETALLRRTNLWIVLAYDSKNFLWNKLMSVFEQVNFDLFFRKKKP